VKARRYDKSPGSSDWQPTRPFLAWMHPFLDGNGRVVRLMSHATMLETLDTGALWSVARGLARNVDAYKMHLANCDQKRRNDLDGRGTLSEEALAEFTRFFLTICVDQVEFMENLIQPDRLRARILLWAEEEIRVKSLPAKSVLVPPQPRRVAARPNAKGAWFDGSAQPSNCRRVDSPGCSRF
jgi:hypothetical protein